MSPIAVAKANHRIEDVVGQYVKLRKQSSRFVGLCPFHDDRNPSMFVFPESGRFKCFSCGASGDLVDFVARIENLGVGEAAKKLAHRTVPLTVTKPAKKSSRKASVGRMNTAYRALINHLSLSTDHLAMLHSRGFTDAAINKHGYRTLGAAGRREVVADLRSKLGEDALDHVPGFYKGEHGWDLNGSPGLLIPVINPSGQVVGLQVRLDNPPKNGKYRWISSPNKEMGASSGTPCHVAKGQAKSATLWITEGPLKANMASERLGITCLGIAGVSAWRHAIPAIKSV